MTTLTDRGASSVKLVDDLGTLLVRNSVPLVPEHAGADLPCPGEMLLINHGLARLMTLAELMSELVHQARE